MKLQIVPFDVAKDLKELGFDWKCMFNYERYNTLLLLNSLTEAPFSINEDNINLIPKSLGEHLFLMATKLNTVSAEDQKAFLQKLEAANIQMK